MTSNDRYYYNGEKWLLASGNPGLAPRDGIGYVYSWKNAGMSFKTDVSYTLTMTQESLDGVIDALRWATDLPENVGKEPRYYYLKQLVKDLAKARKNVKV